MKVRWILPKRKNWPNRFSMKSSAEIKLLAYERLSEAEILCNAGKYDGAFYLAGYSIELMLKAKVCAQLGVDNLFDEGCKFSGINEVRRAVKTHDITALFIFSGLREKFENAKNLSSVLERTNARLFLASGHSLWSEQIRYQSVGSQNSDNVQALIALLNHEEGLLKWIDKS